MNLAEKSRKMHSRLDIYSVEEKDLVYQGAFLKDNL